MQINSLPVGDAVGAGEIEVGNAVHKTELNPTIQIYVGGIIFVISQMQENNFVVQTSHSL